MLATCAYTLYDCGEVEVSVGLGCYVRTCTVVGGVYDYGDNVVGAVDGPTSVSESGPCPPVGYPV